MIVNAAASVDKTVFLHKLKGLRRRERVEQRLRAAWTETGQKMDAGERQRFRTIVPVDMHGFIHIGVDTIGDRDGLAAEKAPSSDQQRSLATNSDRQLFDIGR